MLFNSLTFLFIFLPVAYVVFWRLTSKTQRYLWLVVGSYVFYSFWDYRFCALMFLTTLVGYLAGLGLLIWQDPRRRWLCAIVPVAICLGLLGFFKYTNFFVENVNAVVSGLGGSFAAPRLDIILPIGISFYIFHTLTYIIDAYRHVITPTRNFFMFASYVALFPQLVAGPIMRFKQIEEDLANIDRADRRATLNIGWSFFVIGLIKKVLIADSIAAVIDPALSRYSELSTLDAWLCMLGYSYQLYFDFSGYSDMAVGLGYLFGLRLPQNFNSPYKATDIADFWRRWHISMSSFFRDYVYIPLGGNRVSRPMVYRNLMMTMLLCGLWHGANWTFVFWGGYHGLLLVLQQSIGGVWERLPMWSRRAGTFALVVVGWVFFRSDNFEMAFALLGVMFSWHAGSSIIGAPVLVAMLILAGSIAHYAPNTFEVRHQWAPAGVAGFAVLFGMCLFALYGAQPSPFLYFQF
ncbi:MAG TPA: MBOAT family O-acyltransferase [Candidatus Binatia bacterium]|nr:MBOAT family O-acyltransferase [Candidatus Binatia bacterium]